MLDLNMNFDNEPMIVFLGSCLKIAGISTILSVNGPLEVNFNKEEEFQPVWHRVNVLKIFIVFLYFTVDNKIP